MVPPGRSVMVPPGDPRTELDTLGLCIAAGCHWALRLRCPNTGWSFVTKNGGRYCDRMNGIQWQIYWIKYNDLNVMSLENWLVKGIIPSWAYDNSYFQFSELYIVFPGPMVLCGNQTWHWEIYDWEF